MSVHSAQASEEDQQRKAAATAFDLMDRRHNGPDLTGIISVCQLQDLADYMGLPVLDEEIEATYAKLDKDGDGDLEKHEWVGFWVERCLNNPNPEKQQEVVARHAFQTADEDGGGYLDLSELSSLCEDLGIPLDDDELAEAMTLLDKDGNKKLEEGEFVEWWVCRSFAGGRGALAKKLAKVAEVGRRRMATDIHRATWEGDAALVEEFIKVSKDAVNARDENLHGGHFTPLQYAAYQGNLDLCTLLCNAKAKVNDLNDYDCSALFYAAQQGHLEVVQYLLNQGAKPTATERSTGLSVVDVARMYPQIESEIVTRFEGQLLPPTQPAMPSIKAGKGEGSLVVSFTPVSNSSDQLPAQKYMVKVLLELEGQDDKEPPVEMLIPIPKQQNPVTIKKLKCDATYRVAIAAANSMGQGEFSDLSGPGTTLPAGAEPTPRTRSKSSKMADDSLASKARRRVSESREKRARLGEQQRQQQLADQQRVSTLAQLRKDRLALQAASAFLEAKGTPQAKEAAREASKKAAVRKAARGLFGRGREKAAASDALAAAPAPGPAGIASLVAEPGAEAASCRNDRKQVNKGSVGVPAGSDGESSFGHSVTDSDSNSD